MMKAFRNIAGLLLVVSGLVAILVPELISRSLGFMSRDGVIAPYSLLLLRILLIGGGFVGLLFLLFEPVRALIKIAGRMIQKPGNVKFLLTILFFAFLVRIAGAVVFPAALQSDSLEYHKLGVSLAESGKYYIDNQPTAYRPPGYPYMLGLLYRIFGTNPAVPVSVNVLFSLLIIIFTYLIARHAWNEETARWAALVMAFFPSQILYAGLIMSEPMFTLFLLASLYLFILNSTSVRSRLFYCLFGGVLLGVAVLTRPAALLLIILPAGYWYLKGRRIVTALLFFLFAVIGLSFTVGPWMIRNYRVMGKLTLTTSGGVNLLVGNQPLSGPSYNEPIIDGFSDMTPDREVYFDSLAAAMAREYIESDPLAFIVRGVKKVTYMMAFDFDALGRHLLEDAGRGRFSIYAVAAVISETFYLAVLLLSFFGMGILLSKRRAAGRPEGIFLISIILYWLAVHFIYFGEGRYHYPLIPVLAVFASACIERFASGGQRSISA
jgi:4-amino-4-deoxy-L-arabinose transferase-like glycosyltransferase